MCDADSTLVSLSSEEFAVGMDRFEAAADRMRDMPPTGSTGPAGAINTSGVLVGLESEDALGVAGHDQFQLTGRKADATEEVETVFRVEVGEVAAEEDALHAEIPDRRR